MTAGPAFPGSPDWVREGPVLFIVEIQNRLEKRLMRECLQRLAREHPGMEFDRVFLKIDRGKNTRGLDELNRNWERTVIIATHSNLADALATSTVNLKDGMIVNEVGSRPPARLA